MRNTSDAQPVRPDPHAKIQQKGLQKMEGTVAGAVITLQIAASAEKLKINQDL